MGGVTETDSPHCWQFAVGEMLMLRDVKCKLFVNLSLKDRSVINNSKLADTI